VVVGEGVQPSTPISWRLLPSAPPFWRGDFVRYLLPLHWSDWDHGETMKKIQFPLDPLQPFQVGHVWKFADSFLRIGDVGKTLVHYKRYKGNGKGVPNSLTSKRELETYLTENKAVLVEE
jgi:hypothetical protein